jgi:hypothetical protein
MTITSGRRRLIHGAKLITASLFVLLIGGFLIWMGWRLIDWLL